MQLLTRCRRALVRTLERKGLRPTDRDPVYASWIKRRLRERRLDYSCPSQARLPAIDILTLVFDTPPAILAQTARSVFAQDYPLWRWVIWDNGSTRPDTGDLLDRLNCRPKVEVHRGQRNLGITAGHLAALNHCRGEYVVLLDHDDRLYPDALRVAACYIVEQHRPPFLFSDEDKIDENGSPFCPFFKPGWNPALLQSTGYTCHLTLFRRELAQKLGAFTDPRVEGAADWDLALRFHDAGWFGVHIPEVLYSWRIHQASTAGNGLSAKPYALSGQQACLESSLARRGLASGYRVVSNPVYPFVDGHWHIQSLKSEVLSSAEYHWRLLENAAQTTGRADAMALFALNPNTALVGGRVLDAEGRLAAGPAVIGMGGAAGTPFAGRKGNDVGYFGLSLSSQDVAVVQGTPWVARKATLEQAGYTESMSDVELSQRLRNLGWRLLFCPQLVAQLPGNATPSPARATDLPPPGQDPYYSRFLSLEPARAFQLADGP